ncbi:ISAs1 family transposase [Eubacteriales bacterium OttesenSCG-928-A19]|nr:ISAs1 family transposase [Eubacteriales bacterium OttesenSCG-928-A19]
MIVADARHCQRETAKMIIDKKADYLLCVKSNQETTKRSIAEYVQDKSLCKTMDTAMTVEKSGGRIEKCTAHSTCDTSWLESKSDWVNLISIGAIHRQSESKAGISSQWHYYISSRPLSATDLLRYARMEWSVETMHWLLDVHFAEDFCRVEDEAVQRNLNTIRKVALNTIRNFKNVSGSKRIISKLMLNSLLNPFAILYLL